MSHFDTQSKPFYRRSLEILQRSELPFLIGGAYAFCLYTGISRHTKDFDLFVRRRDFTKTLDLLREAGYRTAETFPHWLGKAFSGSDSIDIIYRAGNGLFPVDDQWFERAPEATLFGLPVRLTPPEEMISMKAYIMERERYDGADVAHLLFHCADEIDWSHLLQRFAPDERVLLSHLILFEFIYPSEKKRIPRTVLNELLQRRQVDEPDPDEPPICNGTLLSRVQFMPDIEAGHFRDARLEARAGLTPAEAKSWTDSAEASSRPHPAMPGD